MMNIVIMNFMIEEYYFGEILGCFKEYCSEIKNIILLYHIIELIW